MHVCYSYVMDNHVEDRNICILYGSQTGTAEDIAESLSRTAVRLHFHVELCAMDDFDVNKLLHRNLVLFVSATTGQGDPPDNMKKFWRFIMMRNLAQSSLSHIYYAVIGLGDSSYPKFNFVAKKLFNRLKGLSAEPLMPVILCDDQHDHGNEAALNINIPKLWENILEISPMPLGKLPLPTTEVLPSKFLVEPSAQHVLPTRIFNPPASKVNPFLSTLMSNDRLTAADHYQDVRLFKLDITGSGIQYKPGDVVYIQPRNSDENVDEFLKMFNLDPNEALVVKSQNPEIAVPRRLSGILTWRELAANYFDVSSVPRKSVFELLSHFSRDEMEKEKLVEFCTPEGQDSRYAYVNRVRRSILEVLSEFRNTTPHVPVNYLFDIIPAIQPRAFSIASAPSDTMLEVIVAVVKYKTKLMKPRLGLCSNWLANKLTSKFDTNQIPVWVQRGSFRFPAFGEPCILIGPGTGVAPFRSFIKERTEKGFHRNLLLFGCRNKLGDFLCEKEWAQLVNEKKLEIITAFSQDQEEKFYVWHAMLENSDIIWDWIHNQGSYIFIAGNAKRMPDDVRATFIKIAEKYLTGGIASEYISRLEKEGRYQLECWS